MEVIVALLACVALSAGNAVSFVPKDNSHYVEGESRYIWMPDGDGGLHFVDLESTGDEKQSDEAAADTQFWLFTRDNRDSRYILEYGNINSIRNSTYKGNRPTNVIVHGFRNSGNSQMNVAMSNAFLDIGDFNVIIVDWNRIAGGDYLDAVNLIPAIGQRIGNFIEWLFTNAGGDFNQLHLVGFSLGAHVVGNAGRALGGRSARVTGLDPAGPLWRGNPNAIARNSGIYVESIHTDGRATGIFDPISHADFYPNTGKHEQPGCLDNNCSHARALMYYISSIRTDHFIGRECISLDEAELNACNGKEFRMGNADIEKRGSGIYGLTTGSVWPF